MCGFLRGKPHAVQRPHKAPQEIRVRSIPIAKLLWRSGLAMPPSEARRSCCAVTFIRVISVCPSFQGCKGREVHHPKRRTAQVAVTVTFRLSPGFLSPGFLSPGFPVPGFSHSTLSPGFRAPLHKRKSTFAIIPLSPCFRRWQQKTDIPFIGGLTRDALRR